MQKLTDKQKAAVESAKIKGVLVRTSGLGYAAVSVPGDSYDCHSLALVEGLVRRGVLVKEGDWVYRLP